jgi:hypothetical protein
MGRASTIRASGITREGSHPVPISWQRKKKHKRASGFASFSHEDLPRTDADLEIKFICMFYFLFFIFHHGGFIVFILHYCLMG